MSSAQAQVGLIKPKITIKPKVKPALVTDVTQSQKPLNPYASSMDWFQSFYTTQAMVEAGYKVRKPIYTRSTYGQGRGPIEWGEEYDLSKEKQQYEADMGNWKKDIAEAEEEEKEELERDYRPFEPLSPATWSFHNGPNEEYEEVYQIAKFDRTTLWRIIIAHAEDADKVIQQYAKATHQQLVEGVRALIEREASYAEMALEYHPVLELMSGVLCLQNWRWLSDADRKKWCEAHGYYSSYYSGSYAICVLLEEQVRMYQEIMDKGWQGDGARGYNLFRARLRDNKRELGLPLTPADEPYDNKRQNMTTAQS